MVAHTALTSQDSQKSFFAQTCTFKRFQPGTAEPCTSPECGMELCQTCICEQNCSRRASEIYFRNSFTYPPLKFQWPKGWLCENCSDGKARHVIPDNLGTLSTFCRSLVSCVFSTCLHWEGEDPQKIKAESHGRNKYNSWRPTLAVHQKAPAKHRLHLQWPKKEGQKREHLLRSRSTIDCTAG